MAEAFRLARTIEDLLVLSRIESEEAPERERVPVHQVVAEAVERIRPAAEQAGIDIDVSRARPAHRHPRRPAPGHLGALQPARQRGEVLRRRVARSRCRPPPTASTWSCEVRDHGIGIPKADLERVFERFYRVDQARSRTTGGTGLGLAIVRHVATNHQGDVRVDSRLGEGSTFELILPSASGPVAGRPTTSPSDPGPTWPTVSRDDAMRETGSA